MIRGRRSFLILVSVFLILLFSFAGCSKKKEEVSQKEQTEKASQKLETTVSLTGNFTKDVITIGKALQKAGIKEVDYSVWGAGDANSVMRVYGIVEGAYQINKILEKEGIPVKVVIKDKKFYGAFQNAYKEFLSKSPLGQAGDFFVNSYVYIPALAKEGYILDLTSYYQTYRNSFKDFYPSLMKACYMKGEIYGIPQDTEARPLYVNKRAAQKIGLPVKKLPEMVKSGEFTWSDVYKAGLKAKKLHLVKWGLIHRKGSAHPDLIQFIYAFSGKLYDKETGKLVLDVPAVYKWFYVEWEFARAGLLPKNIMGWDWAKQIHPAVVKGETLFDIGGTWYWAEWQTKKYYNGRSLTPEELKEKFVYTLFPAGEKGDRPVTLSQPFVWMISSKAGSNNPDYDKLSDLYKKLAFLIVIKASSGEINAIHSIISAHLPVRKSALTYLKDLTWLEDLKNLNLDLSQETKDALKEIVKRTVNPINAEFLADVSYMLDYTHLAPSHPLYPALADIFKVAIDKVIRGEMNPSQGIKFVIEKIKADPELKDNIEIQGEIPKNWKFPEE